MMASQAPFHKAAVVALLFTLAPSNSPELRAATPYESQVAGFMAVMLQAIITGEFAGRRPSQVDAALNRPVCKPSDYDDLRAAATDQAAFDAFRKRCNLFQSTLDATHVYVTAYLPPGYCPTLKAVFDKLLVERVYSSPTQDVIVEYKGSRFQGTSRDLARGAKLKTDCQDDGALRVSAPRVRNTR